MADIRKHAVEPTTRLHLRDASEELMYAENADGKPDLSMPIVAVLYGPGSKEYARANNARQNHHVDLIKSKGKTKESEAEALRINAEFLAACTEALENVEYDNLAGSALFKAVYSDISIGFIGDQVAAHLREWGKFYEGLYEDLKLFVEHCAWLNAIPERPAGSKAPRLSRREQLEADSKDKHYEPDMPDIDCAEYLLGYLWEVGPTMAAGMGAGPITHQELRAWQINTGIDLQPWEVRVLRQLSADYVAQCHKAEKPDCPPPWKRPVVVIDRAAVAEKMLQSIRNMAKD